MLLLIMACSVDPLLIERNIPQNVSEKYVELSDTYKGSLGTTLSKCIKSDEIVFQVLGSGGYTGISYYYTKKGSLIGAIPWSDNIEIAIDDNGREIVGIEPIINIRDYDCTELMRSK